MKKKSVKEQTKIEVPLDIALSFFPSEEVIMLVRYATVYAAKYGVSCQNFLDACEHELLRHGLLTQERDSR